MAPARVLELVPDGTLVGVALVLYRQLPRREALPGLPARAGHRLGGHRSACLADPDDRASVRARSASGWARRSSPAAGAPRRSRTASPPTTYAASATWPRPSAATRAPGWSRGCRSGWKPQSVEAGSPPGSPVQLPDPAGHHRCRRGASPVRGRRAKGHEPAVAQHQEGRQGGRRGHPRHRGQALEELKAFHDLYVHTAERTTSRPPALLPHDGRGARRRGADRISLWFARHEGDLVASTIAIRVGAAGGTPTASSTEKRDVRGSTQSSGR